MKEKKAAIYVRVSTAEQDTEMQETELRRESRLEVCPVSGQGAEWGEKRQTRTERDVE